MMRLIPLLLLMGFLMGCLIQGGSGNQTTNATLSNLSNQTTQTNQTSQANQTQPQWLQYNTSGFSFEYPANMKIEETPSGTGGIIDGEHALPDRTGEVLAVAYVNTLLAYGQNRDSDLQANPTKTASDFLLQDKNSDSMGFFMKASDIGNISTFAIGRDVFVAEMPFKLVLNSGSVYFGRALSLYVPERSLHVNVRILALDPAVAKDMRDQFVLSFRLG